MQIIERVEINYFRSAYSISMRDCKDLNIITGSNDAGKSNILKALNLFFNNETEPHHDYSFLKDLNRFREKEARSAKGRMTIWIKVYFRNFLNWSSLPSRFAIKRTWTRYAAFPDDSYPQGVPATTVGRFLNKIKFHYIPAIRSRETFADLLEELHDTLLADEALGLRKSSEVLASDLQNLTSEMSAGIEESLGIDSKINIPESLGDLFRAFDFSTDYDGQDVPLTLRGDGIQSRHLPFILNYIAKKSKVHHIWGYEEPENSLELSKAFEMAKDFHKNFSKENQIFLTTHSPAFYDLSGNNAASWHVKNEADENGSKSIALPFKTTDNIDESMGLLAVITPRIKEMTEEHEGLTARFSELQQQYEDSDRILVCVEGDTDAKIFAHAQKVLNYDTLPIKFVACDGASNITKMLEAFRNLKSVQKPLIGLYDNDQAGRDEIKRLKNTRKVENSEFLEVGQRGIAFAGVLGIPSHLDDAALIFADMKLPMPVSIEYMFRADTLNLAIVNGIISLKDRKGRLADYELPFEVNLSDLIGGRLPDNKKYLIQKLDASGKTAFADWVCEKADNEFDVFDSAFKSIAAICR